PSACTLPTLVPVPSSLHPPALHLSPLSLHDALPIFGNTEAAARTAPPTIGTLRARIAGWPRRIRAPENHPPARTPSTPMRYGSAASHPVCSRLKPRSVSM